MKTARSILLFVILLSITAIFLIGSWTQCSKDDSLYTDYCSRISESLTDTAAWHLAIYLDINACLTCCENMESWQKMENEIPQCGGKMTIWAPASDSVDAAEVMRLEGITAPVYILDQEIVARIQKTGLVPPVLVLFDSTCQPVLVRGTLPADTATLLDEKIIDIVCSGQ